MEETSYKKRRLEDDTSRSKNGDDAKDPYFRSYANIDIHEDMVRDFARTDAYRRALLQHDLKDKVVLDVGCGSGILSLFALKAGAKTVYAVDASPIATAAELVLAPHPNAHVIRGRIEHVTLPEKVDVIVSEWMGYGLLYENMLESVLYARDHWLKPSGILLPQHARMLLAPLTHSEFMEDRIAFWEQAGGLYGVDLRPLVPFAASQLLSSVQVESLGPEHVLAKEQCVCAFDLATMSLDSLKKLEADFEFDIIIRAPMHGFALWF
eukprot:Colp12_sorted_trinity150504_noHs@84